MRFLNFFGSNGLMLLMLFPPVIGLEGVCGGEGVSWFSDEGSYLIYKMRASTLFFYIYFFRSDNYSIPEIPFLCLLLPSIEENTIFLNEFQHKSHTLSLSLLLLIFFLPSLSLSLTQSLSHTHTYRDQDTFSIMKTFYPSLAIFALSFSNAIHAAPTMETVTGLAELGEFEMLLVLYLKHPLPSHPQNRKK